ncbi:DUF3427 domain-containing protein [Gordonia sp. ABSL11-1]|uniref:DUF3427 domain-containing protein n=1 Tax=Gordonia sp. ABSL11-1 TaxID=3053924 RepID=UPI002573E7AD|nr:DUF3427 domain-containing protein [Gordonia sp. ABSL11-1]MDL9948973.1 DUF3427 domain-containing protein [Gordonia sp. ABSL11-1]
MHDPLAAGIYESVVTQRLQDRLNESNLSAEFQKVPADDHAHVYARHIAGLVERQLLQVDAADRVAAANAIIERLADGDMDAVTQRDLLASLHPAHHQVPARPATPLSEVALLTNTRDEPNMASEISRELQSADRVDLLCAFIRFAGVAVIGRELQALRDRGVPLRVITTTYRGATERRAVDDLVTKYGADVRIRYETASTRLHAKAWLFRRNSGFDTGYVGSSNLSRSAMVDGLEWNVRISNVSTPALVRKFEATFDTYWNDPAFKQYDPRTDAARLDTALAEAGGSGSGRETITVSGLDVQPYPHQERILEALSVTREVHGQHRNLIVAATGTGKTVVAALDYRRLCQDTGKQLSLLFVAHRKEILAQSLRKYREVVGDGSFGELYVDSHRPTEWKHVFASIQSLASRSSEGINPTAFDVVVIDEFHHAAASTYTSLLSRIDPAELLGLTATPERSDSLDILRWFGGRSTYELRLWDALEQDLLCPFHFFGLADNTDLRSVTWSRGDYNRVDLENVYTGNDARTRLILNAVRDYVTDPTTMRALGFCVSIAHAEYMAREFTRQGIAAQAISAGTRTAERAQAFADLRNGTIKCLFAVDIFNEGLDIPDVDTLLMLRPTQSATVFLQQLGRGLRRSAGKAVLTVLDFIGHQRAEFNFAPRFTALTGARGRTLVDEIEDGFPFLPGASRLVLDRQSQQIILDSVKRALPSNRRSALVASVREVNTSNLGQYLRTTGGDLTDIYAGSGTRAWTPLLRDAALPAPEPGPDEDALLRRVRALAHVDDYERSSLYRRLIFADGPRYDSLNPREQTLARMLFFTLWSDLGGFTSYDQGFDALRVHPAVCEEIEQLLTVAADGIHHVPRAVTDTADDLPLLTHAQYRREEVLAAIGFANLQRKARGQAGGVTWRGDTGALFVNLHKDVREFSPTTMYRDFPVSRTEFHWESPNNTAINSDTGRKFVEQRTNGCDILLFVRDRPDGDFGAAPFIYLGPVDYVAHQGERPIAITWHLRRAMPVDVFESGSVVAS